MNDIYTLNLVTCEWKRVNATGEIPPPRDSHSANIIGEYLYVIGGGDNKQRLNDMHRLCLRSWTWKKLDCIGDITAGRAGHVSIHYNDSIFIYGGGDGKSLET
jgi:N-acetylneuraminic acid mutarotase